MSAEPDLEERKSTAQERAHDRLRPLRRWVLGIVLFAGVAVVVAGLSEERRFAELIRRAQPAWLLVLLGLQLATYVPLAWIWRGAALRYGARPLPLFVLCRLAVAELFVDHARRPGVHRGVRQHAVPARGGHRRPRPDLRGGARGRLLHGQGLRSEWLL